VWVSLDGEVAEKIAQINAYLISRGKAIEYQDVAISASFLSSEADYIITRNKRHHEAIPALENKIFTPEEFIERVLN